MVLPQSRTEGFKSKPALKDHLLSEICHKFTLFTMCGCVCDAILRSCKTLHFFPSVDVFVTSLRSCKTLHLCGCVCDVLRSCKTLHFLPSVHVFVTHAKLYTCKTLHYTHYTLQNSTLLAFCGCVCDVLKSCKTLHFLPFVDVFVTI